MSNQRTRWTADQLAEFCRRTGQENPLEKPASAVSTLDGNQKTHSGEPERENGHPKSKHETKNHRQLPNPEPKRHQTAALGGANEGEEESLSRIIVRFTGCRVRPLDPDNFAGSVKDLLDGLRHAGLIPGDEPWRIKLETEQVKVRQFAEEKTIIEIES